MRLRLKEMKWNDEWENYIIYGREFVSKKTKYNSFFDEFTPCTYQVIVVMKQLENKMPVYEAFLKGIEAYFRSSTCENKIFLQEYRKLQNEIYKNMKKNSIDEFLIDIHNIMLKIARDKINTDKTN